MSITDERTSSAVTQSLESLPRQRATTETGPAVNGPTPVVTYHGKPTSASAEAVRNLLAEERAIGAVMLFCLVLAFFAATMIGLAIHVWG